jgi:hypothetical protein
VAENTHPPVDDGLKAIAEIASKFTSDEKVPGQAEVNEIFFSHVQGISRFGSLRYVTHSDKDGDTGLLILVRDKRIVTQIHLRPRTIDGPALNHAGGIQRIGRFLVIPLEPMADGANGSQVTFWDLANPEKPDEIESIAIPCRTHKAGSAGIANLGTGIDQKWYVATCDNGFVKVYVSDDFPKRPFVFQFSRSLTHSYESFCLLGDKRQRLFALGFRRENDTVGPDLIDVYEIDLRGQTLNPSGQRHLTTSGTLEGDVHFRWGAGLEIEDDGRLTVLATKRNFNSLFLTEEERNHLVRQDVNPALLDLRFHINLFEHH